MREPFDQLRNVVWDDPGRWPAPLIYSAAVLAFALFCALGLYVFVWRSVQPALVDLQQQETALRGELRSRYARVNSLALFRLQEAEIQRRFGAMKAQLPDATELPSLLVEISQAASDAALEDRLFTPGNELRHEFYAETPIRMRLVGSFHQLGHFLNGIAGLARIVTLHDLQIIRAANAAGSDALQMDVTAKAYRYLRDDENKAGVVAAANADERAVAHIEPLPDWQPPDRHTYSTTDWHSPFMLADIGTSLATPRKEGISELRAALQDFSTETMQMVGALHVSGHEYGLIRAPDGQIHRVETGQIVGMEGGRITAIHDKEIRVTEIRPDGSGRNITQVTSIGLHQ